MASFAPLATTQAYATLLSQIDGMLGDLAQQFNSASTTPTNVRTNTVRWNGSSQNWEFWNGSAWGPLASSNTYNINISGTAVNAQAVPFTGISGRPTTLSGYGITDGLTTTAASATYLTISSASATYLTISSASTTYQTQSGMAAYAPLASPALTGTPTAPTATAGTSSAQIATTAFVTAAVPAATYVPRAWVSFVGSTGAIKGSANVASVTRRSGGLYTINFTTAFPTTNYGFAAAGGNDGTGVCYISEDQAVTHATTSMGIQQTRLTTTLGVSDGNVTQGTHFIAFGG